MRVHSNGGVACDLQELLDSAIKRAAWAVGKLSWCSNH
jgi:hypothetical protein